MADDGRGHVLHIPAFLLSKDDGDKIKEALDTTDGGVIVRVSLDISNAENKVEYSLFYASPFDFVNWDLKSL